MRNGTPWATAVLGVLALSPWAIAQTPTTTSMPGTPVGTASVQPVGSRLPEVGTRLPKVGQLPAGYNGATPNSPFSQDGWPTVDPDLVVAPYPTPNLSTDTFWDRLNKRWLGLFSDDTKVTTTYTPGIARRNRERRERAREEMLRRMRD